SVSVTFKGHAADPRLPTGSATDGNLSKRCVVVVALEHFTELMIVALSCDRSAGGYDVAILEQELAKRSCVVSSGFERFHVRRAGGRQNRTVGRTTVSAFVREPGGREERASVASIPEHPRTDHGAGISGKGGPGIVVPLADLLPVPTAEQRGAPAG